MKLKAPQDTGPTVGFDGNEYTVENGVVEVPDNAAALLDHGFTYATDADVKPPKKETPAEKKAREKAEKAAGEEAAALAEATKQPE